jgi:hypothetical protein
VVYNFAATPEEVGLNKSAFNRVRMRVSGAQEDDKTKLAHKVVDEFSESLIKDLQKTGIAVSKGVAGELPPDNSLTVQGDFLVIDEGNRTRRMAIGLGAGASKVVTHVECYLKRPDKNVMLNEFKATSKSSRKPGAAETMGVGAAPEAAAAVSGATEIKQGAEGDTQRMAKVVAKEITKTQCLKDGSGVKMMRISNVLPFITVMLVAVGAAGQNASTPIIPIPQQPFAQPVPEFIGAPATPKRIPARPVPEDPFMAPNGQSSLHLDAYQSDTYRSPGPLGHSPEVSSTFLAALCGTVTFDQQGRIIVVCVGAGPIGPILYLSEPHLTRNPCKIRSSIARG